MEEKFNQYLTKHLKIFEDILTLLWKKEIVIKEKVICPQDKKFIAYFVLEEKEQIQLEIIININENRKIDRIGIAYKLYQKKKIKNYLALSFLYQCPYELELCNQYGLYTKKDIKKMKSIKNKEQIDKYRIKQNLLKDNQFYIFNMAKIKEHAKDQRLDKVLQEFNQLIENWNQE